MEKTESWYPNVCFKMGLLWDYTWFNRVSSMSLSRVSRVWWWMGLKWLGVDYEIGMGLCGLDCLDLDETWAIMGCLWVIIQVWYGIMSYRAILGLYSDLWACCCDLMTSSSSIWVPPIQLAEIIKKHRVFHPSDWILRIKVGFFSHLNIFKPSNKRCNLLGTWEFLLLFGIQIMGCSP